MDVDRVVVGAGVVGLACARALALAGAEVMVLERERAPGQHASSRNSEVMHAGLYYPPGSRKARACVRGRDLLYAYAAERGIDHRRLGKLVVAVDDAEVEVLTALRARGRANGAGELAWLDAGEVRALEPAVRAVAGIYSEHTGIIDSHAYLLALQGDLEAAGGQVVVGAEVLAIEPRSDGLELLVGSADGEVRLRCGGCVNAAGLFAPELTRRTVGLPERARPRAHFARGRYYAYAGAAPFSHLVYPLPSASGLGIHATLDLGGSCRFGPDVAWVDGVDYRFDDGAEAQIRDAIGRWFPGLEPERLHAAYTGIRARLVGPGEPAADFRIDGPEDHGIPGLINLLGIESPGLTASLALAEEVAERLRSAPMASSA